MMNWLDNHLVEGWRDSWRWFSVQATAAIGAIGAAIAAQPELLALVAGFLGGGAVLQGIVLLAAFAIIALRLWNQTEEVDDGED